MSALGTRQGVGHRQESLRWQDALHAQRHQRGVGQPRHIAPPLQRELPFGAHGSVVFQLLQPVSRGLEREEGGVESATRHHRHCQ